LKNTVVFLSEPSTSIYLSSNESNLFQDAILMI
jgi:hypothetical protein